MIENQALIPGMELPDIAALTALIQALAPGILILGIRRRFIVGPPPDLQTSAVAYAMVSAVYFTIALPTREHAKKTLVGVDLIWLLDLLVYFGLPLLLGILLAVVTVNRFFDPVLRWIGFQPIHHIPTAWDWVFGGKMPESWVVATLNNGEKYAGVYGQGSYASSSDGERDLFLSEVWDSKAEPWLLVMPKRSILLCGRDIRSVEFFGALERENVERPRKTPWLFGKRVHPRTADGETAGRPSGAEPNNRERPADQPSRKRRRR